MIRLRASRHRRCSGMTLLEIMLALSIFVGAMVAIGQLVSQGSRAATRSQLLNDAILRSESKMHEMLAGALPLQTTGLTQFEDDPAWSWETIVEAGPISKLVRIEQRIEHHNAQGHANLTYSLVRLVRDPSEIRAEATAAQETNATSGSSTGSTSSGTTSGSTSSGSTNGSKR